MKNRTEYKKLNQILHHPSRKDIKFGQDVQAKHDNSHRSPQAPLKRYVAIELVKLMKKRQRITIHMNRGNNVTARKCGTNTLALFKSLKSIKFISTSIDSDGLGKTIITAKLAPLGRKFVKSNIPKYKHIYKYLIYGKKSMKKEKDIKEKQPFGLVSYIKLCMFVAIIIFPISFILSVLISNNKSLNSVGLCLKYLILHGGSVNNSFTSSTISNSKSIFIFAIIIPIILVIIIIVMMIIKYCLHLHNSKYKNEDISQDIKKATRKSFLEFLKENQIKEPDYRFGYNDKLPKIDTFLFKNKDE